MRVPSTIKTQLLMMERAADAAWHALTPAQQRALALAHSIGWPRVRVNTHTRTMAALRESGIIEALDTPLGKRDLTLPGLMVREAGTRSPKEANDGT